MSWIHAGVSRYDYYLTTIFEVVCTVPKMVFKKLNEQNQHVTNGNTAEPAQRPFKLKYPETDMVMSEKIFIGK